jgi:hypothetical protein
VGARHGEQDGVAHDAPAAGEESPQLRRGAPRFGLFENRGERSWRVVDIGEHESINAGATGVEDVVRARARSHHIDDRDQAGEQSSQMTYRFERRVVFHAKIEDGERHRLRLACATQRVPVFTWRELVAARDRELEPAEPFRVGDECDDDSQGTWRGTCVMQ